MVDIITDNTHEIKKGDTFSTFELDGKKIIFHCDSTILVEIGKEKGSYKTKYTFEPHEFKQAVFYYNCINLGNGYKKRLICHSLNKPLLARQFS